MKRLILSVLCLFLSGAALYAADQKMASWTDPRLQIQQSSLRPTGLFATVPISKGELLTTFGGSIINKAAVLALSAESVGNVLQIDDTLWIYSSSAETADHINHSCEPNAGLQGQITLVAMRDIVPGEEVTLDYATVVSEWVGMEPLSCKCNTAACRKIIGANDWQQKALQEKYRGYFAYYLHKKIDALKTDKE